MWQTECTVGTLNADMANKIILKNVTSTFKNNIKINLTILKIKKLQKKKKKNIINFININLSNFIKLFGQPNTIKVIKS